MRKYGPTARQRAASRANMHKLNAITDAAFKALKYRPTPRRVAANLATIKIAQATPRSRESWNPSRFNALKHGLYAQSVSRNLARLGESPQKFHNFIRRITRAFQARGPAERRAARRLAEAIWRHLRLFRARWRRESDAFERICDFAERGPGRDPEHLRSVGRLLMEAILAHPGLDRTEPRLLCGVERAIRAYLRLVVGGDPKFRLFTREPRHRLSQEEYLWRQIRECQAILAQAAPAARR